MPSLPDLLALDEAQFRARFARTPLTRAKRRGLARNAAVALGNSGEPSVVPHLARALMEDPRPLVRAHAAWALGHLGGSQAESALECALGDADAGVAEEVRSALADLASRAAELSRSSS
jgi:epoxyqueuosine reductase